MPLRALDRDTAAVEQVAGGRIELDRNPLVDARRNLAVGLDDHHLAACQLGVEESLAAEPLDHRHLARELALAARPQVLGPDAERDRIARPQTTRAGPAP